MNYSIIYNQIVAKYFGPTRLEAKRKYGYIETHHIVPKCLGGSDEPENLVHLPAKAHFVVHRILTKLHPDSRDLLWALHRMSHVKRLKIKICSRTYQTLREEMFRLGRDDETKAKISETLIGRKLGPHSEEHRSKISAAHMGKKKPWATERIAQLAISNTGKKRTEEVKARMSASIKAAWTPERLAKARLPKGPGKPRGPQSEETKEKKRASWTPERRALAALPKGPRGPYKRKESA